MPVRQEQEYQTVDYSILNDKVNFHKLVNSTNKFRLVVPDTVIPEGTTSIIYFINVAPTVGMFPDSVQTLEFNYRFRQPFDFGTLPSNLTSLMLTAIYDQVMPVGELPASLTKLEFGRDYNHSIPIGWLPSGLKTLIFDTNFNQPIIVGSLPNGLITLRLSTCFDQPLDIDALPPSLTYLKFGNSENSDYYSPGVYNRPFLSCVGQWINPTLCNTSTNTS
ncbi:hypothetical protein SAMD00019534_092840 [Acytostelium subglobosum LB1]|uniref:hypothetical protein n=1 Tax=Acytostelium subglobosum LB1 TaxID=1410327 RepID=UPI000644CB37|nr:hypothetical protein SAMD00019534_092840 [Acytostelium subglobosum LB1]GAM26109.1 hypothetical protein SAMD00019534_092840 [Acytostelium subglobosum LB1]|eukprot:XP_012751152.1 hypothetical protein SAMD00019534_092840 [Acytostelium subglobosum LB1]